ncbi:HypC/HybG/HupF family hydrogenase formation chaperone [Eubacterium sp. An11]|uniref:HypC/HybG/HupF family hydrogenase formation chaperone n=1 Tax=Eubacterium sp. An11 TaxID=1965542 RepID=UPI0031B7F290
MSPENIRRRDRNMCLAMPMKIDQIDGTLARCEAGGLSQNIRIDFITDPKPGDYVMVHAGFAIEKMSEKEALENIELLEEIKNAL